MSHLSIVLPVHNEEKHLPECLATLKFADEIVIVLDKCTDRSKEIALQHGAKIIEGAWEIEGERRMLGIQAVTSPWILEIDADERVTPELAAEIKKVIATSNAAYHLVPFDNYIGQKRVRYGWGAHIGISGKLCLFRKESKTYDNDRVHPRTRFTGEKGEKLQNRIIHYMDDTLGETLKRFDNYTTRHAKDLLDKKIDEPMSRNIRRFFTRFFKCFVMRRGYREGAMGFFVAVLGGLYPLVSALKAKYRLF
ncbi:MAG TPA: glycosyltransferase family 2 protein [Alphaproteobacteria bacterium]